MSEGMGMFDAVGHVDFYPNGGLFMPGCDLGNRFFKVLSDGVIQGWPMPFAIRSSVQNYLGKRRAACKKKRNLSFIITYSVQA